MPIWQEVLRAAALVMIIEALLPFLAPRRYRRLMLSAAGLEDRWLRGFAACALLVGLLVLQLLRL